MAENLKIFTSQEFVQAKVEDRYGILVNSMKKAVCNATPGRQWDESKQLSKPMNKLDNPQQKKRTNPKSWWDRANAMRS